MNQIKTFAAVSVASLAAYFEPVQSILAGISWLIVLNFLFGLVANVVRRREAFRLRKALRCISEAVVFLLLLVSIFYIGDHLGSRGESIQAVSTIAYAMSYFYALNIGKNLKVLFPGSKAIAFLYGLLSIEVLAELARAKNHRKTTGHDADLT